MKKVVVIISVVFALLFGGIAIARAGENIRIFVNGKEIYTDVPPQVIEGRTMVPLRAVGEALGADVRWDDTNNVVWIDNQNAKTTVINPLSKEDYLLFIDEVYSELTPIWDQARNMSRNPGDKAEMSDKFYLLSSRVETLFKRVANVTPPVEAINLHREVLKELVLWSSSYKLTAKALLNGDYNIGSLANEAYEQDSVTYTLRASIR